MTSSTKDTLLRGSIALSLSVFAVAGCANPSGTGSQSMAPMPAQLGAGSAELGNASDATTAAREYTTQSASLTATASGGTAPANAVDGDITSCWSSGAVSSSWIQADCGAVSGISALQVKMSPNFTYSIQTSNDGSSWTTAASNQKNTSWNLESKTIPSGTNGRYVRLAIQNNGSSCMVFEIQPTLTAATTPSTGGSTGAATSALTATASGGTAPANAVDGDITSCWSSGAVSSSWIQADRGASGSLTGLQVKMSPNFSYSIQTSDDGSSWTTAASNQKNTSWNLESKTIPSGTNGRYVRLAIQNNGSNCMVFEIQPQGSTSGGSTGGTPSTTPVTTPVTGPVTTPSTAPTKAPTAAPSTGSPSGTPTSAPSGSGVTIVVNPSTVLGQSNSHLLGVCRNHVSGQFPNGAAKLAAMKNLTPTWGARKYLYRVGHGITDGRNDYSYMTGFHFASCWNSTTSYPYDDIRDALNEADTMGADQMHVVNFGTSNPTEAASYVSYLNHAGDANRTKYPVAQQNVGMFELGNEISWSLERGHSTYAATETQYATRAKQFAEAMRAASDVPIKIGAVAGTNSNWMGDGWSGGASTVKNIINTMGSDVDFLIFHGYPSWPMVNGSDLNTIMAQNEWNRQKLENEIWPAIKSTGRNVGIANTENFDNLYSDATHAQGMFGAMYNADTIILGMNENLLTTVQFCFSHGSTADSAFWYGDNVSTPTPIFNFQEMLAQHWGDNRVQSTGQNIPTDTVTGASATIKNPELAYSASASSDGSTVYVMVLNRTNTKDVTSSVNVGFTPSSVTAYTLAGSNGWDSTTASANTSSVSSLNNYSFKHATITILKISK